MSAFCFGAAFAFLVTGHPLAAVAMSVVGMFLLALEVRHDG